MNGDMRLKNEKVLELLSMIEDLKIEIYSRDKTVELQQEQIKQLIDDLREAKQFETQAKALQIMNNSLKMENARLKGIVDVRITEDTKAEVATAD
jgi:Glu-tRNA(Gln) amidotransferase subunit E-like FAD-binding protein